MEQITIRLNDMEDVKREIELSKKGSDQRGRTGVHTTESG